MCAIHEYDEDGPLQFVAMELVEGADLQRLLREKGPLPPAEIYEVALQVARGLGAIHDAGVIHRDLKTSNIVRDQTGAVRLLDFGIAKRRTPTGTLALTNVERVVGTPEYMSPEQIRGDDLDPRKLGPSHEDEQGATGGGHYQILQGHDRRFGEADAAEQGKLGRGYLLE